MPETRALPTGIPHAARPVRERRVSTRHGVRAAWFGLLVLLFLVRTVDLLQRERYGQATIPAVFGTILLLLGAAQLRRWRHVARLTGRDAVVPVTTRA